MSTPHLIDPGPTLVPSTLKRYRTILADWPWPERGGGKVRRGANRHYKTMTVKQIGSFPIPDLADPAGCHLWSWATSNYLAAAIHHGERWGFKYLFYRPWVKMEPVLVDGETLFRPQKTGLGQYQRCDSEILLFFRMGEKRRCGQIPRQTMHAPRVKPHSRKPPGAHEGCEIVSYAPRIELFARQKREGWDSFGNEVPNDVRIVTAAPVQQMRLI